MEVDDYRPRKMSTEEARILAFLRICRKFSTHEIGQFGEAVWGGRLASELAGESTNFKGVALGRDLIRVMEQVLEIEPMMSEDAHMGDLTCDRCGRTIWKIYWEEEPPTTCGYCNSSQTHENKQETEPISRLTDGKKENA